jgi:hypothetical protein
MPYYEKRLFGHLPVNFNFTALVLCPDYIPTKQGHSFTLTCGAMAGYGVSVVQAIVPPCFRALQPECQPEH